MEKPIFTMRVPHSVNRYIYARAKEHNLYVTDVVLSMMNVGIENIKEVNVKLKRKQKLALQELEFIEATAELKNVMRRAYLLQNFKKLVRRLITDDELSTKAKNEVIKSLLSRMATLHGTKSEEYNEAVRWLRSTKSR